MPSSIAHVQRAALFITAACVATQALPLSAGPSTVKVDSKKELEESSFRMLPIQHAGRDLAADMIDAELSLLMPSATADQGASMFVTRAGVLDAVPTTSGAVATSHACPVDLAVLTDRWQLDVFPIATLTMLSCIFVLVAALVTSHFVRMRRFTRSSPVLVSPPSPSVRNLSITVPSRASSVKGDGGKLLHPITEDPFPSTPTQQKNSGFPRPLSPSPPYNATRTAPPDSPARSTFTSRSLPSNLEKKPSFLSLKD